MKAKTSDLFEALVSMKLTLDIDLLKGVYEIRPTGDEISMIAGHVDQKSDKPLDRPEQFLYEMSKLPQFDERVACVIFHDTFKEATESLTAKIDELQEPIGIFRKGQEIRYYLTTLIRALFIILL